MMLLQVSTVELGKVTAKLDSKSEAVKFLMMLHRIGVTCVRWEVET